MSTVLLSSMHAGTPRLFCLIFAMYSVFMNPLSWAEYLFRGCSPWAASTISLLRGTSQQSLPSKWTVNKGMLDFQFRVLKSQMKQKWGNLEMHLPVLGNNEHNKWWSCNKELATCKNSHYVTRMMKAHQLVFNLQRPRCSNFQFLNHIITAPW